MVGRGTVLHSLPDFHVAYVAAWTGIPSIILVVLWVAVQGTLLDQAVFASLPDGFRASLENRGLAIAEIHSLADGRVFGTPAPELVAAAERSEEHTSELQSLMRISYAVFCLKKKNE